MLECKFFHTLEGSAGFAVMTNKYQFFLVADSDRSKDDIRVKKLADIPCRCTYIVLYKLNQCRIKSHPSCIHIRSRVCFSSNLTIFFAV